MYYCCMRLFRYISPEQVPVQYGGLSKDNDPEFATSDVVTEVIIKPSSKHVVELPSTEVIYVTPHFDLSLSQLG